MIDWPGLKNGNIRNYLLSEDKDVENDVEQLMKEAVQA